MQNADRWPVPCLQHVCTIASPFLSCKTVKTRSDVKPSRKGRGLGSKSSKTVLFCFLVCLCLGNMKGHKESDKSKEGEEGNRSGGLGIAPSALGIQSQHHTASPKMQCLNCTCHQRLEVLEPELCYLFEMFSCLYCLNNDHKTETRYTSCE